MTGETDLARLLAGMAPDLRGRDWGYAVAGAVPAGVTPFATVAEDEGRTVIAPQDALALAGIDPGPPWARISLTIHSDLAAVGLTAAFARALGGYGERVTDPTEIAAAIRRGIAATEAGQPALLEFITTQETRASRL